MTFQFERISERDCQHYGLAEFDQQFPMASLGRWVIDRDTDTYLRYLFYDKDCPERKHFCFYWHQEYYLLQLEVSARALTEEQWCSHWHGLRLKHINEAEHTLVIAPGADLIQVLKAALVVYRDGMLDPAYHRHSAVFDF